MSQTQAYGYTLDRAQAGQKWDARNDVVESFAAEGVVPFGAPVMRGTNPAKQIKASDGTDFEGIALFTHTVINDGAATGYANKDTVSVLVDGAAAVVAGTDGTLAGDDAYVDTAGEFTYRPNKATITFSANFVTSNKINAKINGTSIAEQTFASNHATTFAALVTAIETTMTALGIVAGRRSVVGNATTRVITIYGDVTVTPSDVAVTAGDSQATATIGNTTHVLAGEFLSGGNDGAIVGIRI